MCTLAGWKVNGGNEGMLSIYEAEQLLYDFELNLFMPGWFDPVGGLFNFPHNMLISFKVISSAFNVSLFFFPH